MHESADAGNSAAITSGEARYGPRTYDLAQDFLEVCDKAARLMGRGRAAYDADETLQLASEALMTRFREIGNRLLAKKSQPGGAQLMADTPDIPWDDLRGIGNRTTHEYHALNYGIVWETLQRYVPIAATAIRQALGQ